MNVLALCAGVGGLELGIRIAVPGARTVAFVEREAYAAASLVARMEDGWLHPAPVWSDLGTFDARPWRGVVDCVTSGDPCQPNSVAGRQRGSDDDRWLIDQVLRVFEESASSLPRERHRECGRTTCRPRTRSGSNGLPRCGGNIQRGRSRGISSERAIVHHGRPHQRRITSRIGNQTRHTKGSPSGWGHKSHYLRRHGCGRPPRWPRGITATAREIRTSRC